MHTLCRTLLLTLALPLAAARTPTPAQAGDLPPPALVSSADTARAVLPGLRDRLFVLEHRLHALEAELMALRARLDDLEGRTAD